MKKIYILFSVMLLIYMLWPGPSKIDQFPALPSSYKSQLEGDTIQIPNVSAYFSNNFREFAGPFYSDAYRNLTYLFFAPLRLNYPPEFSWTAIKKHTDSTYLEELVYPLRDSLYVNGFEPFYDDGQPKYWGATQFAEGGQNFFTKTTLRFYPSPAWVRIITWFGILLSTYFLFSLGKAIIK